MSEFSKMSNLYRKTLYKSYFAGFLGFLVGVKICDWMMYDPHKHDVAMEEIEEEFWKIHGEPRYLTP